MDDLIAFLRAREDERAEVNEVHSLSCDLVLGSISGNANDQCDCGGPDFVLADVAAKRQIIERALDANELEDVIEGEFSDRSRAEQRGEEVRPRVGDSILKALAFPHQSHPDYREEWKP